MTIFGSTRLPGPLIAQQIPEAASRSIEGVPEETQVAGGEVIGGLRRRDTGLFQKRGNDQCARIIVRCVSFLTVRHCEDSVLQHSSVVCHPPEVVEFEHRQFCNCLVNGACGERRTWPLLTACSGAFEALYVTPADFTPYHGAPLEVSALADCVTFTFVAQEFDRLVRNGARMVEGNHHAPSIRQQLLRIPIRSGDHRFARAERIGQCSRYSLCLVTVGCNVDVSASNELVQFFVTHKAIVEDDMLLNPEFANQPLQINAILFSFVPSHM